MKSRIIGAVVIFLLLGLGIYATIRATHGIVLFDVFFYKNTEINADLDNRIKIIGRISPRQTEGKTAGDMQSIYMQPVIQGKGPYSLFSRAKCRGADARIRIVSREKIAAAYIREVVTIDSRGENRTEYYQDVELSDERSKEYASSFSEPFFSWHGIYTEGNGKIEISGYVILDAGNERIEFQKSIPIECLEISKVMTRKRWDEFFETWPRSYWQKNDCEVGTQNP